MSDCKCEARWSGNDEAMYAAAGCPNCTCKETWPKPLVCAWCGEPGKIIGGAKSLPGVKSAKCTKCHHEWEVV